jgi:ADP-heptose:LPS heptosyltransferase
MHLADAVATPVVVLFSGTEQVEQFRPRGVPSSVLQVATVCSPCRQFVCPFGLPCLDLPSATVAAEALRLAADHDDRAGFAARPAG